MSSPVKERILTREDRCDKCGAAAQVLVTLKSELELLFCGHHASEHGPKLMTMDGVRFTSKKEDS